MSQAGEPPRLAGGALESRGEPAYPTLGTEGVCQQNRYTQEQDSTGTHAGESALWKSCLWSY